MIRIIFLVAMLSACSQIPPKAECNPTRDQYGKIARSHKVISEFRKTVPCPGTGEINKHCDGYVIDHINPLCNCGADALENLQWQTVADARVKDQWERKICSGKGD